MILHLTTGEQVLISRADADLRSHKWYMGHYPMRQAPGLRTVYLHKEIAARMGLPQDLEVDHRDRDKLNCTRRNIRAATRSQNEMNKPGVGASGLRGVYRIRSKWLADVWLNRVRVWRGLFCTATEAAAARDRAARKYHGKFAYQNLSRRA